MTTEVVSPDLTTVLRRLKLSGLLHTLPERLTLARTQMMPYQDFLLLLLGDEVSRRDGLSATLRAQRARLDPVMQLEAWDASANVTYDKMLLNDLASLRFVEAHAHVAIVGPVGVGKTFLAHALGHIACRRLLRPRRTQRRHAQDAAARASRQLLRGRTAQAHRRRPPHRR